MVHPITGLALCYAPLKSLIKNNTIIGLNNPYFGQEAHAFKTIEEMAEYYVDGILKSHITNEQFILGGWSFGGLVAYEMAIQLQKLGKQAETLIMIDTYNPISFNEDMYTTEQINEDLAEEGIEPNSNLGQLFHFEVKNNWKLITSYEAKSYDGRVCLIRASASEKPKTIRDLCCGWDSFVKLLQIRTTPGRHGKLFFNKNLVLLARTMEFIINELSKKQTSYESTNDPIKKYLNSATQNNDKQLLEWILDIEKLLISNEKEIL